jgi:hypothetical protein
MPRREEPRSTVSFVFFVPLSVPTSPWSLQILIAAASREGRVI